jgi:heptaprenyl diphosphate synthase/octaprenyl-diphosphate synthase
MAVYDTGTGEAVRINRPATAESLPIRTAVSASSRVLFGAREIFERGGIVDDMAAVEALLVARTASRSPLIAASGAHTVAAGGKRLRAALVLLAGQLGHYDFERLIHPAASAELIHAASLVHDDLVDQADQRRGVATVHTRWDNDVALMLGDYLFALAAGEMALSPDPRIITFYAHAVQTIVEGELNPVTAAEPFTIAVRQYLYKIGGKTAALFEAACKAGITAAHGTDSEIESLGRFGYDLGVAFQIVDDVLDFIGDEQVLGKPAGNDLRQGTITLPLIHAVANGGSDFLRQIVHNANPSDADIARAVSEVITRDGVERARADARSYAERALAHLDRFPYSPGLRAMRDLVRFVLERQS